MKLSKQERIGALVIVVIIILVVGVFMFIKPRFETIGASKQTLENKQQELVVAQQKAATKDPLKEQVIAAFDEGETLADMFFEEMTAYEVEAEFRDFLAQLDKETCNVVVNSLTVSEPYVATLAPIFVNEDEISYKLKEYVNQGVAESEEELAAARRQEILRGKLDTSQDVGAITINFEVTALDQETIMNFCDAVNSYYKDEKGGNIRKACMLRGASFSYPLVEEKYGEMIEELTKNAEEEGRKELYKKFNKTPPAKDNETGANTNNPEEEDKDEIQVSDNIFTLGTSITFYSIARMQDPSAQLDAQDNL